MIPNEQTRTAIGAGAVAALVVLGSIALVGGGFAALDTESGPASQQSGPAQLSEQTTLDGVLGDDPEVIRIGGHVVYTSPAGDSFQVDNLSVTETVAAGEALELSATITNPNDWPAVQALELRIDGDVVDRHPFALNPNESETVSTTVPTDGLAAGTHYVSVLSYDAGAVAEMTIEEGPAPTENASVSVENQSSDGTTVTVDSVTLPEGGFVTIHDGPGLAAGDAVGSVIGTSGYLANGSHENVTVTLFDVPGATFNRTALEAGDHSLVAMPHLDSNGNETYDFVASAGADDGPYTVDGEIVVDDAVVTVEEEPAPTENASVSFDSRSSDGTTVTVDSVTMPEGGFLTIHNGSQLGAGDAVGSVVGTTGYLAAGTHENVTVTLFDVPGDESDETTLAAGEHTLVAMPHLDSNGNETYDFVASTGADDGPYIVDGEIVVDDAIVTVEGNATTSPAAMERC